MKPFGIVAYPERGAMSWAGREVDNAIYYQIPDKDSVLSQETFPRAMFFGNAGFRDIEMKLLAKQFPGVLFCAVDLKDGISYMPQAEPNKFSISTKGKLPA